MDHLPWSSERARAVWHAVLSDFDLETHETALLHAICTTVQNLEDLDARVAADGAVIETGRGADAAVKPHPALIEARMQRMSLARLVTALRLPDTDGAQTQLRPLRGVYSAGGAR
ncbi:hypothetical protein [Streptomyces sp. LS1784]|uniref:hypothetical protein n=1 Tax=Streptomyces sp. LS1784 TaxID=2851533 RepID=UPI001CCD50D5|nr:hypothetical protein [Streptomyces sp. LS1784]